MENRQQEVETWSIEQATWADLEEILNLYAHARSFMADHGNPNQWGTSYPPRDLIEKDIREGNSYICTVQGRIAAVFYYRFGDDPTYQVIEGGQWLNQKAYGVVHRITSDGKSKGTASFCLNWALSQCGNLKIDTHQDNLVMQNLLKKNGFQYCGIIYVRGGEKRLAYQRFDFQR